MWDGNQNEPKGNKGGILVRDQMLRSVYTSLEIIKHHLYVPGFLEKSVSREKYLRLHVQAN